MNIINSLRNFINDQDYYIATYNNSLYIYNYNLILIIKDNLMEIKFLSFILEITGNNLKITKMSNNELLIEGIIKNVRYIYE